ncbi:MAG: ribosome-binding factor A [Candidatus Kerfeldbacteria bacterium]|nr:ribosome-binding factor A [Candidatus Kerfeldbacteria bacterium]
MNSLIRAELGRIMTRELELPGNVLLTISQVEVPADYSLARVGLSVIPFTEATRVLHLVQAARGELQRFINHRLRIYRVPRLVFYIDDSEEKAEVVNRLLDKLA